MGALIIEVSAVILIIYGVIILSGKKFVIPKLIERIYWLFVLWAGFITSSIVEGRISIAILIISGLFFIIYMILNEKNKYIICNVNSEQIIEIIREYLTFKGVKIAQEKNELILSGRYKGKINIDCNFSSIVINLKMIDKKIRLNLLRHIKIELNKFKGKKYSLEGYIYIFIGLIVIFIFARKTL
ncbi:hypothetical protein [Clostridium grantii]|uniref:Uncharacterized protein n=1 Tax=Clostridium grantii DSM 8605 TaxID=1121316 RepID=A0A1M5WPS0_9CLOT|nr:hypothetical protein [Clostridium grantii]SHH89595.1 hypothetical protein SAMN02745207_03044 [Clostridium grantii DSM 8605]